MGAGQRETDLRIQILLPTVIGASAFLITSLAIWLGFEQRTWMEAILPVLAGALSFAIAFALVRFLVFFRNADLLLGEAMHLRADGIDPP
jgi:hypothetical protein